MGAVGYYPDICQEELKEAANPRYTSVRTAGLLWIFEPRTSWIQCRSFILLICKICFNRRCWC